MKTTILVIILSVVSFMTLAQVRTLTIEEAISEALKNNSTIKASAFELEAQKQLKNTSFDLPKTDVTLLYGQYNSYAKNDHNITVSQSIPFSVFGSQGKLNRSLIAAGELKKAVSENEMAFQVKQIYHQLAYTNARHRLLLQQDSLYEGFLKSATLRYRTGETNVLEQTTAEAQRSESKNQIRQNETEVERLKDQLRILLNSRSNVFTPTEIKPLSVTSVGDTAGYIANPSLGYMRQQIEVAQAEKKLAASKFAPDLLIGFFSQTLIGGPVSEGGPLATTGDRFTGFQLGLSLPLWFAPHQARIKSAEMNRKAAEHTFEYYQTSLQGQLSHAYRQVTMLSSSLDYYTTSGMPNANRILKQAQVAFREGEIGYAEYLLGIRNALSIKEGYLKTLNDYNQNVIYIEYLTGNK
jgi:cobalt-zinc-cadmium resistance protein CzcA